MISIVANVIHSMPRMAETQSCLCLFRKTHVTGATAARRRRPPPRPSVGTGAPLFEKSNDWTRANRKLPSLNREPRTSQLRPRAVSRCHHSCDLSWFRECMCATQVSLVRKNYDWHPPADILHRQLQQPGRVPGTRFIRDGLLTNSIAAQASSDAFASELPKAFSRRRK